MYTSAPLSVTCVIRKKAVIKQFKNNCSLITLQVKQSAGVTDTMRALNNKSSAVYKVDIELSDLK